MKEQFICGLDLGTSKLAATLAKIDRFGAISMIGIETSKLDPLSQRPLADYIQDILSLLKKKSDVDIEEIVINVSGDCIFPRHSRAALPLSDRAARLVNGRLIDRLNHQARNLGLGLEERLLHEFPQGYIIDAQTRLENPLGMHARRLEVESFLICVRTKWLQDTIGLINQAGCEVKDFVFSGLASGLGVLGQEDINKGCLLIDIGAGLTEMVFFKDGKPRQIDIISFGGNDLTAAIARNFKVPFDLAEEIKTSFATALPKDLAEDDEIIVKKESGFCTIKRKLVYTAIQPKLDQITKLIKKKISNSVWKDNLGAGVIITGGMSLLDGFLEMMELELSMPVGIGLPRDLTKAQFKSPLLSTSIGLVRYAYQTRLNKSIRVNKAASLIEQVISSIRDVYQEYF